MSIEEMTDLFDHWDSWLTKKQKKYMHFYSVRNFIFHYDSLPNVRVKEQVFTILEAYIEDVKINYCEYRGFDSYDLTRKYINKLSEFYKHYLGFKFFLVFRFVIIFGLIGDLVFYLLFAEYFSIYFPVILLCFISYYLYVKISFEKKKRLYGIYY